uniref:Armadillo-like helical domain-containing protein n=1 Tax=Leptobrachium leishanense TaxID=445787 RepID=A0A8C5PAW8_9ANUR
MAQIEKKVGLLRKSSGTKKPLKEKVVLMYDEIFAEEDLTQSNPQFWDELFLMKVNLEYLEGKLESLDGEELMKIKDNINSLFQHCIRALRPNRKFTRKTNLPLGFDISNMLMGFEKAELRMKNLMESLDVLLCGVGSESLKSSCLKLRLCLVTVTDNISQSTILEYVMINSIFEAILQILSNPLSKREHGYDSVVLLALLVNYRKYESVNPYLVKLSIVDDENTLNGMGLVIARELFEYKTQYRDKEEENQTGFFSALTNMVGTILLALYEAVHLNRNFITVLAQSHPEMGLVTVPSSPTPTTPTTPLWTTSPSSDVMSPNELPLDADVQTSNLLITFLKLNSGKLCFIILTCIAEDQYANAFLHDNNMNFRVNLLWIDLYQSLIIETKVKYQLFPNVNLFCVVDKCQSFFTIMGVWAKSCFRYSVFQDTGCSVPCSWYRNRNPHDLQLAILLKQRRYARYILILSEETVLLIQFLKTY